MAFFDKDPGTYCITLIDGERWPCVVIERDWMPDHVIQERPPTYNHPVLLLRNFEFLFAENDNLLNIDPVEGYDIIGGPGEEEVIREDDDPLVRAWKFAVRFESLDYWQSRINELHLDEALANEIARQIPPSTDGSRGGSATSESSHDPQTPLVRRSTGPVIYVSSEDEGDDPIRTRRIRAEVGFRPSMSNGNIAPPGPDQRTLAPEIISLSSGSERGQDTDEDVDVDSEGINGRVGEELSSDIDEWDDDGENEDRMDLDDSARQEAQRDNHDLPRWFEVNPAGQVQSANANPNTMVKVFVGTPKTEFQIARSRIMKERAFRIRLWEDPRGDFIENDDWRYINPDHFQCIVDFLENGDFEPRFVDPGASPLELQTAVEDGNRHDTLMHIIQTFDAARTIPIPRIYPFLASKLKLLQPWPEQSVIAALNIIFERPDNANSEKEIRALFARPLANRVIDSIPLDVRTEMEHSIPVLQAVLSTVADDLAAAGMRQHRARRDSGNDADGEDEQRGSNA